jgi:hypothetical protein
MSDLYWASKAVFGVVCPDCRGVMTIIQVEPHPNGNGLELHTLKVRHAVRLNLGSLIRHSPPSLGFGNYSKAQSVPLSAISEPEFRDRYCCLPLASPFTSTRQALACPKGCQ